MHISFRPIRRAGAAYALAITLLFVGFSLMLFGSMLYWTITNSKIAARSNVFNTSAYAAEGATERVMAVMDRDFLSQTLNPDLTTYSMLAPDSGTQTAWGWPVTYQFADASNVVNQVSVNIQPQNLDSRYAGLFGAVANCTLTATATPVPAVPNCVPATVSEKFQLASIPVFQSAVFYNLDLAIEPGAAMTINGPVFCNANIWLWPHGNPLKFTSTVQAVLNVTTNMQDPNDPQAPGTRGTITFVLTNQPMSHVPSLTLPIGTNNSAAAVESILNLPPSGLGVPNSAGYQTTNQIYLYNECDLIISNYASGTNCMNGTINGTNFIMRGTNMAIFYSDQLASFGSFTKLTNDLLMPKTTNCAVTNLYKASNILYAGYSFVTNVAFYDYREKDVVQAVQIDVAKLNQWLTGSQGQFYSGTCTNTKGHPIDSIYVYNNVPPTSRGMPAVRLVNGQQLPSQWGLTVATPMPLYIKGDYNNKTPGGTASGTNTTYTYPASIMGDAITILSSSWNDTSNSTYASYASRDPVSTTINAACLEGIVVSTNISGTKYYSGGLENFLRLLEDWSGQSATLTYNGSIVVMFPSIYATNCWVGPGTYYTVPTRAWGFDYKFMLQANMPPCAPQVKAVLRNGWSVY